MNKCKPTKVVDYTAYHSMGYSPRFIECPNCRKSISKSWEKPKKCSECDQLLLWR